MPHGVVGDWFNVVEKMRDHSHVRPLTVESLPKRQDFGDWLERRRTSNGDRVELIHLFRSAASTQREGFVMEYEQGGDVLAFTDEKTRFHAAQPGA